MRGRTETRNWAKATNSQTQQIANRRGRSKKKDSNCTSCISMAYAKLHDRRGRCSKALLPSGAGRWGKRLVSPLSTAFFLSFFFWLCDLPSKHPCPQLFCCRGRRRLAGGEASRRVRRLKRKGAQQQRQSDALQRGHSKLLFCMAEAQSRRWEMMLITNCLQGTCTV